MSWASLDPELKAMAERVLTEKQLVAYRLSCGGLSEARISTYLGISRRAVRDRLHHADLKISNAIRQEAA